MSNKNDTTEPLGIVDDEMTSRELAEIEFEDQKTSELFLRENFDMYTTDEIEQMIY